MQARNTYDRSAISSGYISTKPGQGFSTPIQEDDDYDDDNDEAYHDEEDAQAQHPGEPEFYGPASWEEVDTEELERIAVNIMRSVVPSTENLEVGARLAMQAAAMEADNNDPLGLGRIDTRQLALVKAGQNRGKLTTQRGSTLLPVADPTALRRSLRRGLLDSTRSGGSYSGAGDGGQSLEDLGAGGRKGISTLENVQRRGIRLDAAPGAEGAEPGSRRAQAANLAHLRARVIPTQEKFDPHVYLGTLHWETGLEELKQGRANLAAELTERTGQLKALVKENFDHFISCKTTIDDIHRRLSEAERGAAGGAGSLVSTADVVDTVREVQEVAAGAFAELVERAAACDRIRGVLALLKRYDHLFRLPSRIRHAHERGAHDQACTRLLLRMRTRHVIGEYKKARALMAGAGASAKSGVWANLFNEVEKGVAEVAGTLLGALRAPRTSPAEAAEAWRHLLLLAAEGAPCLAGVEPVQIYLSTQAGSPPGSPPERHVGALLEAAGQEHGVRLRALQQRAAEAAAADVRFKELQHLEEASVLVDAKQPGSPTAGAAAGRGGRGGAAGANGGGADGDGGGSAEALWARYAQRLTAVVVRHLRADYWHLPHDKEVALLGISEAARRAVEGGRGARARMYEGLLKDERLTRALTQLAGEGRSKALFLDTVREAVAGLTRLAGRDAPPAVYATLQHVLEAVAGLAIGQLVAERATLVLHMAAAEDWGIVAATHKTGAPVSGVPGRLRAVVCAGMEQVQAVLLEAACAEAVVPQRRFSTLATSAPALRSAFFESFTAYAIATDRLSQDVATAAAKAAERNGAAGGLPLQSAATAAGATVNEAEFEAAAAAAAAADAAADAGAVAGAEEADLGADRKLLVLLSNCAFVRGSIMPTFAARFRGLLVADESEAECANLAAECCEDIRQVELRLASAYSEAKAAALNDVLEELFFDDGTLWTAAPLPAGVRDITHALAATMAGVEAEMYANSPGLLRRVLAELLQHTLATFATILAEQLPETSLGGVLQLLVDLQYLAGALSPLVAPSHEAVIGPARELILSRALELAGAPSKSSANGRQEKVSNEEDAERLERWLQGVEASTRKGPELSGSLGDRIARACRALAVTALKESRLNVACFREAPAPQPQGPAAQLGGIRGFARQGSGSSAASLG